MFDVKKIARTISVIENHLEGYENILLELPTGPSTPVIGITGSPGSGKSTLVDALISEIITRGKTVCVVCIDPSSPFNMGALLGDRIRMSRWYTNERVFIRSLASRKELGGLCPMIIEITEYLKTIGFDFVIVETVGVGQSEIEIAGLSDITLVNLVPESGDEVQTMKAGIMEIADVFVVNKCDKPGADSLIRYLNGMLSTAPHNAGKTVQVVKTVAQTGSGVETLYDVIEKTIANKQTISERKYWLLAEKAYQLIQMSRMEDVRKADLFRQIKTELTGNADFNLYRFVQPMLRDKKH